MTLNLRGKEAFVMNKKVRCTYPLVLILSMTVFSGCATSSKYACKGQPDGVICADPVAVYHMTEERDEVTTKNEKKMDGAQTKREEVMNSIMRPPVDMAKPVLEPAQVLRIWLAPWVDEAQDLHGASYVFTEITPRRWTMGVRGAAIPHAPHAFQMLERSTRRDGDGIPLVTSQPIAAPKGVERQSGTQTKRVEPVQPPTEDVEAR